MEGIFIFGNETQGWYRIGTAQSIEHKFAEISAIASLPLKISAQWPCQRKYCHQLETHLKDLFASRTIHGDWFALTPDDLIAANAAVLVWKAHLRSGKDSRKLGTQINFLVEPAMYDQLRLQAFNFHISISSLIRRRLTPMTHDDFLAAAHDPELHKPTLAKILAFLESLGFLKEKKI
jgi:hypothetical protein